MFSLLYPAIQAPVVPAPNADTAVKPRVRETEYLPLIDESGLVKAMAARSYVHSGVKCLHPVVHLHIIDRSGRLYLQKRASTKKLLPGYWDTAVGGHVSYGESIGEALFREASEELGLHEFNPVFLQSYIFESSIEKELVSSFAIVGSYDIHPDEDEVECGRFWTFEELDTAKGEDILTPNFIQEFDMLKDKLIALL